MIQAINGPGPLPHNPWMVHPLHRVPAPKPCETASVVEYLRWMRILREDTGNHSRDSQISLVNNGEVVELLDIFEKTYDYNPTLERLTNRTKRLADDSFEVKASWRIRIGGMRGPESMLLPAFDALGMPYLPSTTLKGVARSVAMRETRHQDPEWTVEDINSIFGQIEPEQCMGQVIFLDAYPCPFQDVVEGSPDEYTGLVPDMANSIWTWQDGVPTYRSNLNTFISLRNVSFVVGLRRGTGNSEVFNQVKKWLLQGLAEGIGSRVNSGYGVLDLVEPDTSLAIKKAKEIMRLSFQVQGQLIHGRQADVEWRTNRDGDKWQPPAQSQPEVRPPAFRSMLRYWFRTFALGVLDARTTQRLELEIFGGIEPEPLTGLFQLEVLDGVVIRDNAATKAQEYGRMRGELVLRYSSVGLRLEQSRRKALLKLLRLLTWFMFHLGGVGLGARRPCYSRQDRPHRPFWRGSTLIPKSDEKMWTRAKSLGFLQKAFRVRLRDFYDALSTFAGEAIAAQTPRTADGTDQWAEAIDRNCRIVCVKHDEQCVRPHDKPPALDLLHTMARQGQHYDPQLCGAMATRSPIWIASVRGGYDVVTIFGIENECRQEYFNRLRTLHATDPAPQCLTIWPLTD
ncbi:MAG: type III-B CRISPR module RAMP protein Cmr6 [Cyanothece sp. SIO2G6]|nr:type III-B CRISPR module RAMP protein Cmr6 [Cyanothece sp. SIO2G6]